MNKKQPRPASNHPAVRPHAEPALAFHRLNAATWLGVLIGLVLSLGVARVVWGQEAGSSEPEKAPVVQESDEKALPPAEGETEPVGSPTPAPKAASRRSGKGPRTLDEINIEGEIAVPQVLFITARERKFYQDFLHRHYLKGSQELCRETRIPTRLGSWLRP